MFNPFKKKSSETAPVATGHPTAREFAPGTELPYDPNLIAGMKTDHAVLFSHFDAMLKAAYEHDLSETAKHLAKFRARLHDHLLKENLKLYTYLGICVGEDNKELVTDMRTEMSGIGKQVTRFLRQYTDAPVTTETVAVFLAEANNIRQALSERMAREEATLYTLYMPPSAY